MRIADEVGVASLLSCARTFTPVFDGTRLGEGATVDGPALIEEPYTVVVLPPDATATLDGLGNYVVST